MHIDWLRSFLAVSDCGSFGAAATSLFRAQSRVSAHIAALEAEVGAELFDRMKRPIALTPAGVAFLPHARAICSEVEAGGVAARAASRDVQGHITLGVYPSAGAIFIPSVLCNFRACCPEARVELSEHAIAGLDAVLSQNLVTMALRPAEPAYGATALEIEPLWLERLVVIAAPRHSFGKDDSPVPLPELAGVPLVVTGVADAGETEAGHLLAEHGIEANVVYQSDQPQTLVGLVRAGLGVGLTNDLALRAAPAPGLVRRRTVPALFRQVNLVRRPDRVLSKAATELRRVILSAPLPEGLKDLRTA